METWAVTTQAKNKLAAAQTKMERSMLNITYRDRKTNIWVREKTKVTDVIEQVRRRKWIWARHVSRIRENRWTLRITTWKPYERKRLRGRPSTDMFLPEYPECPLDRSPWILETSVEIISAPNVACDVTVVETPNAECKTRENRSTYVMSSLYDTSNPCNNNFTVDY